MKRYLIPKGKHYPKGWRLFRFRLIFGAKKLRIRAMLTDSCIRYPLPSNQGQVNKLGGYGHNVRIGWCADDSSSVRLYVYWGSGTGAQSHDMTETADPYDLLEFSLRPQGLHRWVTWVNYPYFGGKEPAPRDMEIFYSIEKVR